MRFGFKAFTSGFSSKRLRQLFPINTWLLLGLLLALTVGCVIFTCSLHYPYTLLTVHNTVSSNATSYTVCSRLHSNASLVRYDILKPLVRADFDCISTKTSPAVTVCLFDIWHDVYVSRSLKSAGIWEPYLVKEFIEAVQRSGPNAGVCIFYTHLHQPLFLYVSSAVRLCNL